MKYLSLFSGVEAATLAWEPLGWEAVAYCEFAEFPSAVLNHHWPDVPNFGDVTAITEKQIKALGHIDLVVFGSPCQDLSLAGKRKGLEGERSGLFRSAIQVVKWCIKHCGTRFALWENVPGAYSSNEGADFCEVLSSLCGSKLAKPEKWSEAGFCFGKTGLVEWCCLDAQYFGVPQRRRRVFAFADFGDWTDREPVFPEPESMQWDSAPGREEKENASALTSSGVGTCGADDNQAQAGHLIPSGNHKWPADVASTLDAHSGDKMGLENQHINEVAPLFVPCYPIHDKATRHAGVTGKGSGNGLGAGEDGDPCPTLTTGDKHAVCDAATSVRRITPIECERLQGMPDNHTKIPWKGKPAEDCPDGPRYQAIGNSMAVPVMRWIGTRIASIK